MASWNAIFHRAGRGSRALGVGVTLVLASVATLAPSGCTLDRAGVSTGGVSASTSSTITTGTSESTSTGSCWMGTGCTPCVGDVDCGMPTFDGCTASICVASFCAPKDTKGLLSITQTPGNCMKSVCGADGKPAMEVDPNDTPDDMNVCTQKLCVGGVPTKTPAAIATPCPNGKCDGKGACVNCTKDDDCKMMGTSPSCDLTAHTCISCSDGLKNGTETAIDCGGGTCGGCTGAVCAVNMDCTAALSCVDTTCCTTTCTGTCMACNLPGSVGVCSLVPVGDMDLGTCTDPTMACDGAGSCRKTTGQVCAANGDCASNTCLAGFCRAPNGKSCGDNAECASKLCKGMTCSPCGVDADCPSSSCIAGVCKAPNGSPCDINADCSGGKCQGDLCKLDNNDPCAAGLDCVSGFCSVGKCLSCVDNNSCPGSSCGMVMALGFSVCRLPVKAYCETPLPIGQNCNTGMCNGFPASCK